MDIVQNEVESLYTFRDEYFVNKSNDPVLKEKKIEDYLKKCLKILDDNKDKVEAKDKGQLHFWRGKALNVTADYREEAENELGKATKFNLPDAWNELGECQYKKGDLASAKTCFEKALMQEKKGCYYRNLSMLMRSLPWKNQEEREHNITEGLKYAKEAVKLDSEDGHSWLILGNAYLALFFTIQTKQDILRHCKAAYAQAEKDSKATLLPELHHSKFQIEWYEESYTEALQSLLRAYELDPTWEECHSKYEECRKFLSQLAFLYQSKGNIGHRRIKGYVKEIDLSQLGPFRKEPELKYCKISELEEGPNNNKVVLGKVVCTILPESGIPFGFCMIDEESVCTAVTVYNWVNGCGVKISDFVAIMAPFYQKYKVRALLPGEMEIEFPCIRVPLPLTLVVNKRRVGVNQVAKSQIVSQHKPY